MNKRDFGSTHQSACLSPTRRNLLGLGAAGGMVALLGDIPLINQARAAGTPPTSPKGQVVIGLSQEPTVFNPLKPGVEVDQGVWWSLFDPLWAVDPQGNLLPRLAMEIPTVENGGISADGLSWKIKLRPGVKWHDGAPFTAEDVKFTLDLINRPGFAAGNRQGHSLVRDITVTGPLEISWKMESVYAPYLSLLAWTFIVPQHILSKAEDPNTAPFNNQPVGTGAFRWGERASGDRLTLVANTNYFGDGPYLERVIYKYIADMNALYTQFRTGQIDHVSVDGLLPNFYADAKKLQGLTVVVTPSVAIESIAPNLGHPVLGDKAVRKALYGSFNKKAIIDIINYGLPTATESFMPREAWFYNANLPAQKVDVKGSNAILDQAGWVRGSDGMRKKGNQLLEFAISTTTGNSVREQTQQLLQQDWKAIGVNLKINNMPAAVMWGEFWVKSKFESALVGSTFMTGNDPDCAYRFSSKATPATGGSGSNVYQYNNPEVDRLLAEGRTVIDRAARKAIYQQIQALVHDDLAVMPIYQYAPVFGYKNGLMGYAPNTNVRIHTWNVAQWYWAA